MKYELFITCPYICHLTMRWLQSYLRALKTSIKFMNQIYEWSLACRCGHVSAFSRRAAPEDTDCFLSQHHFLIRCVAWATCAYPSRLDPRNVAHGAIIANYFIVIQTSNNPATIVQCKSRWHYNHRDEHIILNFNSFVIGQINRHHWNTK